MDGMGVEEIYAETLPWSLAGGPHGRAGSVHPGEAAAPDRRPARRGDGNLLLGGLPDGTPLHGDCGREPAWHGRRPTRGHASGLSRPAARHRPDRGRQRGGARIRPAARRFPPRRRAGGPATQRRAGPANRGHRALERGPAPPARGGRRGSLEQRVGRPRGARQRGRRRFWRRGAVASRGGLHRVRRGGARRGPVARSRVCGPVASYRAVGGHARAEQSLEPPHRLRRAFLHRQHGGRRVDRPGASRAATAGRRRTPGRRAPLRACRSRARTRGRAFGAADTVGALVEFPRDVVLAPARQFLGRLILIGAAILGLGLLAAWGTSRTLTRPLARLTRAADVIAMGDYTQPVAAQARSDELGRLAAAFDVMVAHVRESRQRLEERVRARTRELQERNQELEAFAYSISHDLRSPLRAMEGFSQALLEEYADRFDETGRQY